MSREIDGDDPAGSEPGQGGRALAAWVDRGNAMPLERWLDSALDPEGVPRRWPVCDWVGLLAALDGAWRRRPEGWPERLDARIEGFFRATLRFARSSGLAVFTPPSARPDRAVPALFRAWADRLAEPGLGTVVDWWFPGRAGSHPRSPAAPPLPAWSSSDQPLAMLRANWSSQGDFLAVDHRERGRSSLVELTGLGHTWLGPAWETDVGSRTEEARAAASRPRPSLWVSNSSADLAEWSFRLGSIRVTRTALLLRGRRIAILADQVEGRSDGATTAVGWRVGLPQGVEAAPLAQGRGLILAARRGSRSPSARVIPLGLPRLASSTERGDFALEGGQLRLRQNAEGRRCWLPLLVSWDPLRNRRPVHWRVLTVGEKSRICPAGTAFAARISWGRGETLLIYRSLAPPALRSVLGHQTRARFLVALFTQEGEVVPIVKID